MEWATPNSAPIQRLPQHERERMSGVASHVTTMQLEGSRNEGGWKGRGVQGDTSLALSRHHFQRSPDE